MAGGQRIVVIGAGHNGLVCAATLAQDGHSVTVLEAADALGGASVTREFHPGFRVSACAHLFHGLHPAVMRRFDLRRHGLAWDAPPLATISLNPDGQRLVIHPETVRTAQAVKGLSTIDAQNYPLLYGRLERFAAVLAGTFGQVPPRLKGGSLSERATLLQLGLNIRRLGRADMREFLRIVGMNVADLLDEHLRTRLLAGPIAFDAVLGSRLGPRAPNTVLNLLYRLASTHGGTTIPTGGMGSVTAALGRAARAAGAEIRTGAPVQRIVVDHDRAAGVLLQSGETLAADIVVSNADPKRTFLSLLGTEYLDTGFIRRIRAIPTDGVAAKLHLALDALPEFKGLYQPDLRGRLVIAPSVEYVERAHNPAKYGEISAAPVMEITLPSLHDASLAPPGKHVLSAVVQYAPYGLRAGWDSGRAVLLDTALATLESYAPGLKERIIATQLLSPADLEAQFANTGGHWHHGELGLERILMLRPIPGWARYATPLPGLFLCGAGCHPGGGVLGAAGHNAARVIHQGVTSPAGASP